MICWKATVALPGANPSIPEHKNAVFMRVWLLEKGCSNSTLSLYGSCSGYEAAPLDADEAYLPLSQIVAFTETRV